MRAKRTPRYQATRLRFGNGLLVVYHLHWAGGSDIGRQLWRNR